MDGELPDRRLLRYARNDSRGECHCEERSDEAIPFLAGRLLSPHFTRNDKDIGIAFTFW